MTAVDIYLKTNFSKNCLEKMTPYNNISANSFKAMKLVTVTSENSCGKCSITFSNKMKRKNKNRIRPSSEQTENGYGSVTIDFNTVDQSLTRQNSQTNRLHSSENNLISENANEFSSDEYRMTRIETSTSRRQTQRYKWVFRQTDPNRTRWDLFVMILATWNCFSTPYFMAFMPDLAENDAIVSINSTIDILFFFDIVLNFRTTYFDQKTGKEVMKPSKIFKHYLKGTFFIDFLASIPSDLLMESFVGGSGESRPFFQLFGLLKLIRIRRLNRIILYLRVRDQVKMTLRLLQLLLFLVMYVHVVGCIWFMIVKWHEDWVPPTDFILYGTQLYDDSADLWWKYWICFYTSIFLLIGGEVAPRGPSGGASSSAFILIGNVITAIMFGEMAVLMSNMQIKQTRFQQMQDNANTTMKNMEIPDDLQLKIYDYLVYTQGMLDQRTEFEFLEGLLSPSLQKKVHLFVYDKITKLNDVFCKTSSMHEFIVHRLRNKRYRPEEDIVTMGTKGRTMYFLASGECSVFTYDLDNQEILQAKIKPGGHFGEVSLLYNRLRTATVRASNYCSLGEFDQDHFELFVQKFPSTYKIIKNGTLAYKDPMKLLLWQMLRRIEYFEFLADEMMEELIYSMDPTYLEPDSYLFLPGKIIDEIFFVINGSIELSFTFNDKNLHAYKRRSKRLNIEYHNPNDRIPKYPEQFKLTKKFKRYSRHNLKNRPEIMPIFGVGGIVGSANYQHKPDNNLRYPQELILRILDRGDILNSIDILKEEAIVCTQAKALTPVVVYQLSKEHLVKFSKMVGFESVRNAIDTIQNRIEQKKADDIRGMIVDINQNYNSVKILNKSFDIFKRLIIKQIMQNRLTKYASNSLAAILAQGMGGRRIGNGDNKSESAAITMYLNNLIEENSIKINMSTETITQLIQQNDQSLQQVKQQVESLTQVKEEILDTIDELFRSL